MRQAFEKHLVEEMAKRSQDASHERIKTADKESDTVSDKFPMRVQETLSSPDSDHEKRYAQAVKGK